MQLNTVNLCYRQALADERERERERKPRHYPSGACGYTASGRFTGTCRRATWLDWNGAVKTDPPDAPALFKMRVGDIIHDHLNGLLDRALAAEGWAAEEHGGVNGSLADGVGAETENLWQHPSLKFPFSGRFDKRMVKGDARLGCEWKSIYGRGADFVMRDGPKDDAMLQVAIYLEQDVLPIDEVALIYATRDSGLFIGFAVTKGPSGYLEVEHMKSGKREVSEFSFDGILRATQELEASLENLVAPPPRDYGPQNPDKSNSWRCEYCKFKTLCGSL